MKKVIARINRDGSSVTIEAEGFKGTMCEGVIEKLAGSFGRVSDSERKPEYYEKETNNLCEGC